MIMHVKVRLLHAEAFMTGLSKAMFEVHEPDVAALKAQLLHDGKMTPKKIADLKFSYFKKRYVAVAHLLFTDRKWQTYMQHVTICETDKVNLNLYLPAKSDLFHHVQCS